MGRRPTYKENRMRFVSRYGSFAVKIHDPETEAYASGIVRVIKPLVQAQFKTVNIRPEEIDLAKTYWRSWNGSLQQEDEVTTVPPDHRIGVFDSEEAQLEHGWDDELRLEVEAVLVDYAERFEDVLVVPATMIPPPWPRYDEYTGTPTMLVRKLIDEGHDLNNVLAYEQATQNRAEIVAELEEVLNDEHAGQLEEVQG